MFHLKSNWKLTGPSKTQKTKFSQDLVRGGFWMVFIQPDPLSNRGMHRLNVNVNVKKLGKCAAGVFAF